MSESIPILSVRRSVQNISQERIDALGGRLLEGADDSGFTVAQETVHGVLSPAHRLFTSIIAKGEFLRIQRKLGDDRLDDERVEELEARLKEAFSDHPKERDVETLPPQLQHWGETPKLFLSIAKSIEIIRERRHAQSVILDFIGLERPPEGWFSRTRKTVPAWLAVSETREEADVLKRLVVIIEKGATGPEEERPLPTDTKLGEVKTKRSFRHV